jgi:hypothetical protein
MDKSATEGAVLKRKIQTELAVILVVMWMQEQNMPGTNFSSGEICLPSNLQLSKIFGYLMAQNQ